MTFVPPDPQLRGSLYEFHCFTPVNKNHTSNCAMFFRKLLYEGFGDLKKLRGE